ncbi:hypothetical protein PSHT_16425 [Puccinia striiformis]|uniref:Uncharacterized protein n=1 Tax=Puccinia striiformis TaxID=27350 RepID=A0A2S4UA90_9BASI|nr:hypothetical protein PSHT_16425 [Puccinia striiformis]
MLDSKTTWRFPNSSEIWMTVKKMMMMTKGTSTGEETQSESTNSDNDAEQDEEEGVDLVEIDSNELELGTAKLGDNHDGSSDEDESTWKSYHVTKPKSKKKKINNDPEAIAEEEERRILELEEVKRLQAKARSKLISSDFCSYLDYASEDEIIDTKVTKKLNQDRVDSSLSALVNDFDSEPEAVAYLLKAVTVWIISCVPLARSPLSFLTEFGDRIPRVHELTVTDLYRQVKSRLLKCTSGFRSPENRYRLITQQQERIRKHREKQEQERSQSSNDKLDSTHEDLDPPPHLPDPSSSLPPDVAMADDMSPDAKTIVLSLREELAAMRQSQAEIKHLLGLATAPPPAPAPAPARDPSPLPTYKHWLRVSQLIWDARSRFQIG